MQQIIISIFLACFYMATYLAFGLLLPISNTQNHFRLCVIFVKGFFLYYLLFGILSLIMTLILAPLRYLSITWFGCILLTYLFILVFKNKILRSAIKVSINKIYHNKLATFFLFTIILSQVLYIVLDGNEGLVWDNLYYIGETTTNIFTDTIKQYDPYSGDKLNWLLAKNLFVAYGTHSSVMCQTFSLAPLVEYYITMTIVIVIISNAVSFIVFELYTHKKSNIILGMALSSWTLFWSFGYLSSPQNYVWSIPNAKFSVFPFVIIPMFYYCWKLFWDEDENFHKFDFFLVAASGCMINMTATIMSEILLLLFIFSYILYTKKLKRIIYICFAMFPCGIVLLYYFVGSKLGLLRYIP